MKRREFMTLLSSAAAAWPVAAWAQQSQRSPVRVGVLPLGSASNPYNQALLAAFRRGLREAGLVEGQHVVLDVVWVESELEFPAAVKALMQRGVDDPMYMIVNLAIMELRQGLVANETQYFADRFQPAPSRSHLVEKVSE